MTHPIYIIHDIIPYIHVMGTSLLHLFVQAFFPVCHNTKHSPLNSQTQVTVIVLAQVAEAGLWNAHTESSTITQI